MVDGCITALLNAWADDPPGCGGDSHTKIPDSWDVQSVETLCGPELTDTLVLMTFLKGARPKISRMASPEKISTEQAGIKPSLAGQHQK